MQHTYVIIIMIYNYHYEILRYMISLFFIVKILIIVIMDLLLL